MSTATVVSPAPSVLGRTTERLEARAQTIPEKLRIHGFACVAVTDSRMFPWIRKGDLVFVRRIDLGNVAIGDLVLVEQGGRPVLRRALQQVRGRRRKETRSLLVTNGGTLDREYARISSAHLLGRAIRIHRGKKHIDLKSFERRLLARMLAGISNLTPRVYRPLRSLISLLIA